MSELKADAMEQAERLITGIAGGPGYYGRLYSTIAAALLRARADEAEKWKRVMDGWKIPTQFSDDQIAALRRAADELEQSR